MLSADVKSAFLKRDPFVARESYISRANGKTSPSIPIPDGCFADARREWWLRLALSLESREWRRNPLDQASWLLWDHPVKWTKPKLQGMIVSHVDDLLFRGDKVAEASLMSVRDELGFHEVTRDSFVWCGKQFSRLPDGSVDDPWPSAWEHTFGIFAQYTCPEESEDGLVCQQKQFRALLGSFQWLVAQLRFDMAVTVSSLQGEKPSVRTLLRANAALAEFSLAPDYEVRFQPVNTCAVVVTDATLGNVAVSGSAEDYHRSCVDAEINAVNLVIVVDAKDVHDKASSDTSSFGSQKSLAFTIAWLRAVLRRPNTCVRWTATSNMFADAGAKHMDLSHLRKTLKSGRWSVAYSPASVKQVSKAKRRRALCLLLQL